MQKFNSNLIMIFLLIIIGIYLVLGLILNISLSETIFMTGLIFLFLILIIIHGGKTLGLREILFFLILAYAISLLYEYTDGLGFGELVDCKSSYSDLLGPKFFGKVPYMIPLVWSMFLYCAFSMTNIIFNRIKVSQESKESITRKWLLKNFGMGIVSGLIMTSWDLINDPVMVKMGAWSWSYRGSYYGIPLWNFEVWIEISALIFILFSIYLCKIKKNQIYIGGHKKSNYTLFVVLIYLGFLIVYIIYAFYEEVIYVIPWATITMGSFSAIAIIRFYQFKYKNLNEQNKKYKDHMLL